MKTELEFYQILYKITQAMQPVYDNQGVELRYKRINSFAVIDDETEMYAESLGKDARYKPSENPGLFFNRNWDASGYVDEELRKDWPILYLWENPENPNKHINVLAKQPALVMHFRACLADQYIQAYQPGLSGGGGGGQRPKEIIKSQLREIRNQLLQELKNWVYYEAALTAGGTESGHMNKTHLASQVGAGLTYSSIIRETPITVWISNEPTDAQVGVLVDPAAMVAAYSDLAVTIEHCQAGSFTYGATVQDERLDHPDNASA